MTPGVRAKEGGGIGFAVARILPLVLILAGGVAAPARAATIDVNDRAVNAGERLVFSGTGFQASMFSYCPPAGPIDITIRRGRRQWSVGRFQSAWISPFSDSFRGEFRAPEALTPGRAYLLAEQRTYRPEGLGCVTDVRRASRFIAVLAEPFNCGADCEPFEPVPRFGVNLVLAPDLTSSPGALPQGASLQAPTPVCVEEGQALIECHEDQDNHVRVHTHPGYLLDVGAVGFDPPEGCPKEVAVTLVDRSGTAFTLARLETDEEGAFRTRITLPSRGITPGLASLTAAVVTDRDGCRQSSGLRMRIRLLPRTLALWDVSTTAANLLAGVGWATDRCDGRVEILLRSDGRERLLARVRPAAFGGFSVLLHTPAAKLVARNRLVVRQTVGREVGDPGHRRRAHCVPGRPDVDRKVISAKPGPALAPKPTPTPTATPTPTPSPTPAPTPAPAPDPKLSAVTDGVGNLRVRGTGWPLDTCSNPVTLRVESSSGSTPLGSVSPASDGSFDQTYKSGAKPGDATVFATQPGCGGASALERSAPVTNP